MWAKYGSQSSDFSVGILFVTFCLAQAARVIGCPGVCINIKNGYGRPGPLCYQRLPQSRYYHVLWIKVLLASNSGCFRLNKWFRLVQALQRSRTLGALKKNKNLSIKLAGHFSTKSFTRSWKYYLIQVWHGSLHGWWNFTRSEHTALIYFRVGWVFLSIVQWLVYGRG